MSSVIEFPAEGPIGHNLMPKRHDIEMYQNDTFSFDLTFKNSLGAAIDVTGWTVLAQIKNVIGGTLAGTFQSTVGGINGKVTITLPDAITVGQYKYDVQVSDGTNKRTYIGGFINVSEDISE